MKVLNEEVILNTGVLVAYASKHGATREIAERIAQTMASAGQQDSRRRRAL